MKGWPLLRALLALLVLLAAGWPLRSLTQARNQSSAGPVPATNLTTVPQTEKLTVSVIFTQPPQSFSLKFLGQEIMTSGEEPSFEASTTLEAHFPAEGIDLVFDGMWPEYFRKVGTSVRVKRADETEETQTVWGKRKISAVLTFAGKERR